MWRYAVPVAVVAVAGMTAHALDTSWIATNQPVSSSKLKGNFDEIETRLAALEASTLGYPAVMGATSSGDTFCGPAPTSFTVGTITNAPTAAYGQIFTTSEGAFSQNLTQPYATTCIVSNTTNYCRGPITFFLNNPNAAKTITISTYMDNGPSYVYVDGNQGANAFLSTPIAGNAAVNTNVSIPTGSFALSFIVCSTDGPSLAITIGTKWITANSLTVDYDRTYHRNGK
jgi:hypothetical protein